MFFNRKTFPTLTILLGIFILFYSFSLHAAEKKTFKPFVLAKIEAGMPMGKVKKRVKKQITESPFTLVAGYSPYDGAYIFIITSDELKSLAAEAEYGGFAAPQRISLTQVGKQIQIAYTNPVFMQYAYRMKDVDLQPILDQMTQAFGFEQFFGGEGLTARKLKRYKYSFGLEDFDSFYELPEYNNHVEAITALIKGFRDKSNGISRVYQIKIPGKEQVVFGISMNADDANDEELNVRKTMDIIDYLPLKRTAYLPYEIMVDGDKILAMHARFRIAVYFNDLKMFGKHGFGKLLSTPSAYEKAFLAVSGAKQIEEEDSDTADGFIN